VARIIKRKAKRAASIRPVTPATTYALGLPPQPKQPVSRSVRSCSEWLGHSPSQHKTIARSLLRARENLAAGGRSRCHRPCFIRLVPDVRPSTAPTSAPALPVHGVTPLPMGSVLVTGKLMIPDPWSLRHDQTGKLALPTTGDIRDRACTGQYLASTARVSHARTLLSRNALSGALRWDGTCVRACPYPPCPYPR
jgi:hypothetical protein